MSSIRGLLLILTVFLVGPGLSLADDNSAEIAQGIDWSALLSVLTGGEYTEVVEALWYETGYDPEVSLQASTPAQPAPRSLSCGAFRTYRIGTQTRRVYQQRCGRSIGCGWPRSSTPNKRKWRRVDQIRYKYKICNLCVADDGGPAFISGCTPPFWSTWRRNGSQDSWNESCVALC